MMDSDISSIGIYVMSVMIVASQIIYIIVIIRCTTYDCGHSNSHDYDHDYDHDYCYDHVYDMAMNLTIIKLMTHTIQLLH